MEPLTPTGQSLKGIQLLGGTQNFRLLTLQIFCNVGVTQETTSGIQNPKMART